MPVKFLLSFFILILLNGCSLLPDEEDETKDWSAQRIYAEAKDSLNNSDYSNAIKYYEILEARYPFGKYATQGQLDLAYAYYKADEPESAIATIERFIKLYPTGDAAAYAYYLRGVVNFSRNLGFFERFLPTDPSQRDQGAALQSLSDFEALITKFPNSEYADDARQRIVYLRNNLASLETHIARYYLERGAYIAAANRAQNVINEYQRTPSLRESLEILIQAYEKMGKPELAQDAERVLALNLEQGTFITDYRDEEDESFGVRVWKFFGLDQD